MHNRAREVESVFFTRSYRAGGVAGRMLWHPWALVLVFRKSCNQNRNSSLWPKPFPGHSFCKYIWWFPLPFSSFPHKLSLGSYSVCKTMFYALAGDNSFTSHSSTAPLFRRGDWGRRDSACEAGRRRGPYFPVAGRETAWWWLNLSEASLHDSLAFSCLTYF